MSVQDYLELYKEPPMQIIRWNDSWEGLIFPSMRKFNLNSLLWCDLKIHLILDIDVVHGPRHDGFVNALNPLLISPKLNIEPCYKTNDVREINKALFSFWPTTASVLFILIISTFNYK